MKLEHRQTPGFLLQAPGLSSPLPSQPDGERGPNQRLHGSHCYSENLSTSQSWSCLPLLAPLPLLSHSHWLGKWGSTLKGVTSGAANLLLQDQPLITQPASTSRAVGENGLWGRNPASRRGIRPGLEMKGPAFKSMTSLLYGLRQVIISLSAVFLIVKKYTCDNM